MDFLIELSPDGGGGDLVVRDGDLVLDHGLRSNVLSTLFSDQRRVEALPDDPQRDADPRGYWADTPQARFGSLLWTMDQARLTDRELAQLEQYAAAALQWMIDAEIARKITATALRIGLDGVELTVELERAVPIRWQQLWDAEETQDDFGRFRLRLVSH